MNLFDTFALNFLTECTALIDRRVVALEAESSASEDPDAWGVFDSLEYVVGFGFVACQQYVTTVASNHKQTKKHALELGPQHRTGQPMVAIVNAAANYWKHSPEWELHDQGEKIRAIFEQVGGRPSGDYPVSSLLCDLLSPLPPRFERLVPFLERWKDEVANVSRAV